MKKTIIVVLGGGGHTAQIIRLINLFGSQYDYEYIIAKQDKLSINKILIKGKVNFINRVGEIGDKNFIRFCKHTKGLYEVFLLLINSNAQAIITCGPNISVPICIIGKMLNKKVIFIETWSKVKSKTSSGRFIYYFADLFFIQWKRMKKIYPKAIYTGRLS